MTASPGALDEIIPTSRIRGTIPSRLHSTRMLSNGPGWTRIGSTTAHPFDGHGYLRAFEFQPDGSLRVRARFVETDSFLEEREAGSFVRRGFATNRPGPFWRNLGFGQPRNVANTTIVNWGGRLLAGWEAGLPHALDPETLETQGEHDFGGLLESRAVLAHMKHDAAKDRLVLASPRGRAPTRFTVFEIDADERLVARHEAELPGMTLAHDFGLSESWVVLAGNPLRLQPRQVARLATGRGTLLQAVSVDDREPGRLHLVSRNGSEARTVELPDRAFVVHFGGAFESEGCLHVDACVFRTFGFGDEFGYSGSSSPFDPSRPDAREPQRLVRITIPDGSSEATWRPLSAHGIDFPRIHPAHEGRKTPRLFGATRADPQFSDPFDSVIGIDLEDAERDEDLWHAGENVFVGEPLFVPDPAREDRGHVLALVSDGLRAQTTLVVLDATKLHEGPIASVEMPLLPVAFHGDWDPGPWGGSNSLRSPDRS
jgi:carotenoid cleavage dioxygenase-like enzyme